MSVRPASVPARRRRPLPVRLRTVLLVSFLGWGAAWVVPRAEAAWKLHGAASAMANYGACMVGPTGPTLLRDRSDEFPKLLRRRLLSSMPEERPFAACAPLLKDVAASDAVVELERAHIAKASDFREFGFRLGVGDKMRAPERSLAALTVTTDLLRDLSERAKPLFEKSYARLMVPSRGALEAIHPVATPRPSLGLGLPRWRAHFRSVVAESELDVALAFGSAANLSHHRTKDGGITWKALERPPRALADAEERCNAGEGRAFTLTANEDSGSTFVTSAGPDAAPLSTELAPGDHDIVGVACDAVGFVAATKPEQSTLVTLRLCGYQKPCEVMNGPRFGEVVAALHYPMDIARIAGTTIVAVSHEGVVRVASSRDGGQSWTPYSVAFDAREYPELRLGKNVPDRLLTIGQRVLLYAGADKPTERYPVLASLDHGASFRSPESVLGRAATVAAR